MDLPVYMHNGCSVFTRSAHLMLDHLRHTHSSAIAPFGLAVLDGQISEHLLATSPPGTLSHVCLTCNVVLGTRFHATAHLSLPQHIQEYDLALNNTGQAGIQALLTRRWMTTTQAAQDTTILAPETSESALQTSVAATRALTGSPNQLRYLQSFYTASDQPATSISSQPLCTTPKILRLFVSDYTTRARFPATLDLRVVVPRTTCTVAGLARCVEVAFVRDACGEKGAIDWARVIAVCGVMLEDGEVVCGDDQVAAWVVRGTGEERAEMKRRVW